MLKVAHLSIGLVALLVAAASSLTAPHLVALPFESASLALMGLLNLQFTQTLPSNRTKPATSQLIASLSLIAAAVLQSVALLAFDDVSSLIACYAALLLAAAAVALSIFMPKPAAVAAAPRTRRKPAAATTTHARETGTVKWFNTSKGFGFISRDSGDDVFVHFRAIRGEGHRVLNEGQRVEFSVTAREKGLQAEDVIEID